MIMNILNTLHDPTTMEGIACMILDGCFGLPCDYPTDSRKVGYELAEHICNMDENYKVSRVLVYPNFIRVEKKIQGTFDFEHQIIITNGETAPVK